jgi:hypothetical protein
VKDAAGAPAAAADLPVLRWELGPTTEVEPGVRSVTLRLQTKAEFDRMWYLLTDDRYGARLDLTYSASVYRPARLDRTWEWELQGQLLRNPKVIDPRPPFLFPAPQPGPGLPTRKIPVELLPDRLVRPQIGVLGRAHLTPRLDGVVVPETLADALSSAPVRVDQDRTSARPDVLEAGLLAKLVFARGEPLVQPPLSVGRSVRRTARIKDMFAPPVVADGPEFVLRAVSVTASIDPLRFDPQTNAYLFEGVSALVVPTDDADSAVVRDSVVIGDRLVTYLLDLGRGACVVPPDAFLVPRRRDLQYRPELLFTLSPATLSDGTTAEFAYSAKLTFRVMPSLSPLVVRRVAEAGAARLGRPPAVLTLNPRSVQIALDIPAAEGAPRTAIIATSGTFENGLTGEVKLSSAEFERVFARLIGPETAPEIGLPLDGMVTADAGVGTPIHVPMRISFSECAGEVLDLGPVNERAPGEFECSATNRLESPVRVQAASSVLHGGVAAVMASPERTVAPEERADLHFNGGPTTPSDGTPTAQVVTTVVPDADQLWPRVMQSTGYADQTFDVVVSVDPAVFGIPPEDDDRPLTALAVRFLGSETVRLDATQTEARTAVRMDLLAFLRQAQDAEQGSYRVTNLHGPGGDVAGHTTVDLPFAGAQLRVSPA